jgi:large subunit ribosomal protein L1
MSKNYAKNLATVEKKVYTIEDAITALMAMELPKFKSGVTVELRFKLNIDPTKADQLMRSSVVLPHGTGNEVKVAAFVNPENEKAAKAAGADIIANDTYLEELKKTGKIEFDAAVAEPDMMKKLAPLARVLGTAGVMPSPKNHTVGTDIEAMIKMLKSGKIDIKNDKGGNVHLVVGKINKDFTAIKLVENVKTAIEALEKSKPEGVKKKLIASAYLKSTMSPSVQII